MSDSNISTVRISNNRVTNFTFQEYVVGLRLYENKTGKLIEEKIIRGAKEYELSFNSLRKNTKYDYQAFLIYDGKEFLGSMKSFKTKPEPGVKSTDDKSTKGILSLDNRKSILSVGAHYFLPVRRPLVGKYRKTFGFSVSYIYKLSPSFGLGIWFNRYQFNLSHDGAATAFVSQKSNISTFHLGIRKTLPKNYYLVFTAGVARQSVSNSLMQENDLSGFGIKAMVGYRIDKRLSLGLYYSVIYNTVPQSDPELGIEIIGLKLGIDIWN
jgi:hypothetical protein